MWHKKFKSLYELGKKADLFTASLLTLLVVTLVCNPLYSCSNRVQKNIEVCFTPGNDCSQLIEKVISQAEHQILVQAYYFTSAPIAQALIKAYETGVVVKILVDRSQLTQKGTQLKRLLRKGISVLLDNVVGIAHNKVMVIDDLYVLTGSYNWTHGAEHKNAENLLLITDKITNQAYKQNWEQRAQQGKPVSLSDIRGRTR